MIASTFVPVAVLVLLVCASAFSAPAATSSTPCLQMDSAEAANADPSLLCPVCSPMGSNATGEAARRVRREVRSLSPEQLARVVRAMHVMKETPQAEGESFFGQHFKSWDYFVVKHAVTTTDARGDQGHFSAAFISWHAALVYEFENALLAIDPAIEGVPYWDSARTDPPLLSPDLFGSVPGTGSGSEVVDGLFASFPVTQNFSMAPYERWIDNEDTFAFVPAATGALRSEKNTVDTVAVTRYGSPFAYEAADFETCRTLLGSGVRWEQWYECVELGSVNGVRLVKGQHISLHSGPHVTIGGTRKKLQPHAMGDFKDVVTSPNDPVFMLHHANLDRSKMWWMLHNEHLASTYWGYPASGARTIPKQEMYPGINLNEPMASTWGFSADLFGWGKSTQLLTHADSLCNFSPRAAPYVYDDMQEVLAR
eukprot:TRINITY_DN21109_c0_g1_i1.p1 TRINITY_DN21109_c0_g1~~TRINITY_DN21109_c0_g1_i1.p1  ORF type:complete len:445 (+),score=149.24 TRINITY_DN21109_c0_g1_i1:61-1335(+)